MRNATLQDLAVALKDQQSRKVDMVVPATSITSADGVLSIHGAEPVLEDEGVTLVDGRYVPTAICDEGIASKLGIPVAYLRKMRSERPDLYDANVNGWLHGSDAHWVEDGYHEDRDGVAADTRSFLIRCFTGTPGVARAFLSDRYRMVDNLDVLTAALQGIEDAGVQVNIEGCDLSDRRMYVRVVAPEVQALAETLLKGYRNPFGEDFDRWRRAADREGMGYGDGSEPIVFAGLVVSNSEVGNGAFSIVPRVVVKVCKNGLTINRDMVREVHLGGKLEEGVINWSADTQQVSVDLVRAKTRDAVSTFLSPDYLTSAVERMEQRAGAPVANVAEVQVLTKALSFTADQTDGILNRFVQGGQMTRGGVVNAITAHAQEVTDADEAHDMEQRAVSLLV